MRVQSALCFVLGIIRSIDASPVGAHGHLPCGIVQPDGSFEVLNMKKSRGDICSRLIMTNCSSRLDMLRLCPDECPFLDGSSYSMCGAACVRAEQCGQYRRAFAFANNASQQCERCPSFGCSRCAALPEDPSSLKCLECHRGFYLSFDGRSCSYNVDFVLGTFYTVAVILLVACLGASVALLVICNKNAEPLTRGIEHRNRCLPHLVETAPCTSRHTAEAEVIFHSRSPLYPVTIDVHGQNVVGVGLALYYNHLVFVAVVAAVCWAILKFADDFLGLYQWSVLDCGYGSGFDVDHIMTAYSRRRAVMALLCWAAVLPASIIFARCQAAAERTFDNVHTLMEDYTLALHGLPDSAVDPGEIQDFVERLLGTAIEGVSIAYDYRHCREEIRRLLDEHLVQRDNSFEAALGVPRAGFRSRPRERPHMPVVIENEELAAESLEIENSLLGNAGGGGGASSGGPRQQPRELLNSLRGTGEAFVVMKREEDVERFFALWDQTGLPRAGSFFALNSGGSPGSSPSRRISALDADLRLFRGVHPLELREVSSEPTSVVWDNMGVSEPALVRRVVVGVATFMVLAMAFNYLLYMPYFRYVLAYARHAGQAPTALQTSGLGVVVSLGNTLVANAIWIGVPRLGFQRKDQADIVTFFLRWVIVLLNTLMLVVLTALKLSAVGGPEEGVLSGADAALDRSEELGREAVLANSIFVLFLTGSFTVSYICFWISYPLTYWQAVLPIRAGFFGDAMSARSCERLMEPMEIWLPWDYASHIQLTCCVFVPLFLAEPPSISATRRLCAVLFAWCGVMYCAQRVVHLRFSKETFFSTGRLDKAVLVAWAVPVGQLAMAAVFWAARALELRPAGKTVACVVAFLGSCVLYWWLLYHALEHQKVITILHTKKKEPYQKALARLRYSYFNTNPVHVLLSEHCPEMSIKRTTLYEAGKAYLQAADPKVHAQLEAALSAAETAPAPDGQQGPRSRSSQLMYKARVWLAGAPQQDFQTLDGGELSGGMPSAS
mmetsp:Transcript_144139/g.461453  ORF Transcript_144139/g.461453 Transcript_144139/m.461453 type:complete len:1008 (+) Transcript_144139:49-3072(+)